MSFCCRNNSLFQMIADIVQSALRTKRYRRSPLRECAPKLHIHRMLPSCSMSGSGKLTTQTASDPAIANAPGQRFHMHFRESSAFICRWACPSFALRVKTCLWCFNAWSMPMVSMSTPSQMSCRKAFIFVTRVAPRFGVALFWLGWPPITR